MDDHQKKIIYVNYADSINETKVKSIMSALSNTINTDNPDIIYVLFSSSGGQVEPGVSLYNFLRSLPVELIFHNTGSIDSIANIIFLAANKRYTAKHSSFLFHGINWNFEAKTQLPKNQLTEILSNINLSESKISGIITERTKLTPKEVRALFRQGQTKDATFALSKGIVSEIREPMIPKGVPIHSFNLP
jgi:ATP-dependent protease ClpP protease subunit